MKFHSVLLLCFLLSIGTGHAQQQTWRSADGQHSFQGEFVRLHNEVVTLRGGDGVEIQVPMIRLDEESRARAQAARLSPEQRQRLLLLHETPHYRLTLHSHNTLMRLQLLENGNEVKHPILELRAYNFEVHDRRRVSRSFQAMESPLKREGNTVTWRGRMANNVVVEFVFELGNEGVEFGYRREVPKSLNEDVGLWVTTHIPAWLQWNEETRLMHGILAPEGVNHEQIPALFEDFGVQYRDHDSRRLQRLSFVEPYSSGPGNLSFIRVDGPFSRKSLEFSGPRREDQGSMRLQFYEGGRPFSMGMRIRNGYPGGPSQDPSPGMFGIHFR
jgi:hypothetical protein